MNKYFIIVCIIITSCSSNVKVKKTSSIEQNLYIDAMQWCKALQKSDLKLLYHYTPKVDLKEKSYDKFVSENAPTIKSNKEDGMIIDSFTLSLPSRIVNCNGELQGTLSRILYMFHKGDHMVIKSNIIGISEDKGITWTFINGGKNKILDLKRLYPTICDSLSLKNNL